MSASLSIGQEVLDRRKTDWNHLVVPIVSTRRASRWKEYDLQRDNRVFENTSSMKWNACNNERGGALEKDVANRELLVLSSREIIDEYPDCSFECMQSENENC